jgi:DNA gyrase subunit A
VTDTTDLPPFDPGPGGRIEPVDLQVEMQRSYLDYAMSVIVQRALPDVRDGLKPVHRRVLYAMYDGGYRPDRGFSKCSRVVGDVMGQYHPHGDTAIYDTLVRLGQPWSLRYPLVQSQGNFGSPGDDRQAAMRYTECRLAPLAMEMVRDIDQETVDFAPNYDGRQQEPTVLPARFPNLLVNGSGGIAVGMATNIPPHNLREVASGVMWHLDHPEASHEELLAALLERIKGPDFPTKGLIVGTHGIRDAYTTGRGSVTMRAVVEVEEDSRGRTILVITELPYQVNPDALARKIAELADSGKVQGIADLRDDSSSRTGMRLVVVLKRDAVASVVRNNLYKHTQLQDTFGCNMLALVDGVPRTLALDAFIRHWVTHQVEVIVRRTTYLLRRAEERAHILRGLLKALDRIDEVIALIRASATAEAARDGLIELLEIDEIQAVEILNMQLRRLAALERQELLDRYETLMREIEEYTAILASSERQRQIVRDELDAIVEKYGDERRTQLVPYEGDMSAEDFIPEEDVVVTITRGGYAKRTRSDLYRAQRRGGKGVRGAQLRQDDLVEHFFVTTTHHWILFFTNKGRVYRAKAYQLPDAGRDARGQHVANLLGVPAGRADRADHRPQGLRGRAVPGAGHEAGHGQEDPPHRVRLEPHRRPDRHQPARGRRRRQRRADLRPSRDRRRRPAAGQPEGHVGALHRHRRGAASDGPGHLGRHRHAVQGGRRAAGHGGRPPRADSLHGDRRGLREADRGRGVPVAGPGRLRHPGDEVQRGPRVPGRCRRGGGRRRGLLDQGQRRCHPRVRGGGQSHGACHHGCAVHLARRR